MVDYLLSKYCYRLISSSLISALAKDVLCLGLGKDTFL